MALTDEEVRQVEELVKDREEKASHKSPMSQVPIKYRLGIAAVFIGLFLYAYQQQWTMSKTAVWVGGGVILVWLLFLQDTGLPVELTEQQCHISLAKKLRWKQRHAVEGTYSVPVNARITVTPTGRRVTRDGKPLWREFLVKYKYPDGLEDEYLGRVDVFTGDIVGMQHREFGYYGTESVDIRTIPGTALKGQKMAKDYLDGGYRR